jgi:hypothetical protein
VEWTSLGMLETSRVPTEEADELKLGEFTGRTGVDVWCTTNRLSAVI